MRGYFWNSRPDGLHAGLHHRVLQVRTPAGRAAHGPDRGHAGVSVSCGPLRMSAQGVEAVLGKADLAGQIEHLIGRREVSHADRVVTGFSRCRGGPPGHWRPGRSEARRPTAAWMICSGDLLASSASLWCMHRRGCRCQHGRQHGTPQPAAIAGAPVTASNNSFPVRAGRGQRRSAAAEGAERRRRQLCNRGAIHRTDDLTAGSRQIRPAIGCARSSIMKGRIGTRQRQPSRDSRGHVAHQAGGRGSRPLPDIASSPLRKRGRGFR